MTLLIARRLIGWSQEKLADESQMSLSTIQRIEAFKHSPSIDRCRLIVDALRRGGLQDLKLDDVAFSSAQAEREQAQRDTTAV